MALKIRKELNFKRTNGTLIFGSPIVSEAFSDEECEASPASQLQAKVDASQGVLSELEEAKAILDPTL